MGCRNGERLREDEEKKKKCRDRLQNARQPARHLGNRVARTPHVEHGIGELIRGHRALVSHSLYRDARKIGGGTAAPERRRFKSAHRNQNFFSFNHFRKPCNHPNLCASVEIRESSSKECSYFSRWA